MAEQQNFQDDAFVQGAEVEVCLDDHGFRGSWYSATVLETFNQKNDKILLKFHSLMTEGDDDEPLTEYISVILVRPIPPRESKRAFSPNDEVDAFHNDGWWEGVVISVPEDSKYTVFFRCSREQIDFHESELRLHREWVNGKWAPPMEEEEGQGVASADADDSSPQSHHRAGRTTNGH